MKREWYAAFLLKNKNKNKKDFRVWLKLARVVASLLFHKPIYCVYQTLYCVNALAWVFLKMKMLWFIYLNWFKVRDKEDGWQLNGIQTSYILLFTPVFVLMWHVKMSKIWKRPMWILSTSYIGTCSSIGSKCIFAMCMIKMCNMSLWWWGPIVTSSYFKGGGRWSCE